MYLGMKTAGGIDKENVNASALGSLHPIVNNRGRIGTGSLFDQLHTGSPAPSFQLFDRRGAKRVTRDQQNLLAVGFILGGEFADGGGFADAVDAEEQHDPRPH